MKTKTFTIKTPEVARRGQLPPPGCAHRDRKNGYNRRDFKNRRDWE